MKGKLQYWILLSLLILIPLLQPAFGADWYDSNWLKARQITIDQTDIDSDLTNYPLYVNMTLVNVGTDSQADCDDFVFTDSTNATKLDHETETCSDANNWAEFWVEVPTVSGSSDTTIYMYYNNVGSADQQNTQGTWASHYEFVWHLNGTFVDSTMNRWDTTNSGSSADTDEYIGQSRSFDGLNYQITTTSSLLPDDSTGTISLWIRPNDILTNQYVSTSASNDLAILLGFTDSTFDFFDDGAYPCGVGSVGFAATDDTWQLIAYSYSDALDDVYAFKNGAIAASDTTCGAGVQGEKTYYRVGTAAPGTAPLSATVDEVRFSTTFRADDDWIKADWECQRGAVDGNSCITVGNEGTEPTGQSQSYADTLAITDTLLFSGTGAQVYSDTLAITDTLVFTGEGSQTYADTLAITDDLVFIYNDLNPDFAETLDLTDTYTQLCTGTCGAVATPNAIILSVNKSPFIMGVYSDATRMSCPDSIVGGVIYNTDDSNLNICIASGWILPNGTAT